MTNTDTERPARFHYHAGWNMPGYLPECDVASLPDFIEARSYMMENLEWHADSQETWCDEHDCDDIPCPTYGDNCPWNIAQDLRMLVEELDQLPAQGDEGTQWLGYAGNLAYWITTCTDDCELDTEDM